MAIYQEEEPLQKLHAALKARYGDAFIGVSYPPLRVHLKRDLTTAELDDAQKVTGKVLRRVG